MKTYANIDGHRLEVGPGWAKYTAAERAKICNGVGGANQPQWQRDLLSKLRYLAPAAKPHDIDYDHGGDSAARLAADRRFRRNCLAVAKAEIGPWWKRLLVPACRHRWLFALALVNGAYAALRVWGRANFNYTDVQDRHYEDQ